MRPRQKIPTYTYGASLLPEVVTLENGCTEVRFVDQVKDRHLPSPEVADLRLLLDAGVNVKRVDSRLFHPDTIITDLSLDSVAQQINIDDKEK